MKYKLDQKTKAILIWGGIISALLIFLVYAVNDFQALKATAKYFLGGFKAIIFGLIFAYLLSMPSGWIERRIVKPIFKKAKPGTVRTISIVITMILLLAITAGLISIVIPHLVSSLTKLLVNLGTYSNVVIQWLRGIAESTNTTFSESVVASVTESLERTINGYLDNLTGMLPTAWSYATGVFSTLFNAFIGLVISIYILADRERLTAQFRKVFTAILPDNVNKRFSWIIGIMSSTFRSYITGALMDAVLVGVECYIACLIAQMPYAPLIGVIVGITNIIPIIGPFTGASISTLIILVAGSPIKALIFVAIIIVIQQLDGNVVAPRIIGDRTGVSGIWVVVGVMLGSYFLGIRGVLLSIPIISVVINLLREFSNKRLEEEGKPVDLEAYYDEGVTPRPPKTPVKRVKKEKRAETRGNGKEA